MALSWQPALPTTPSAGGGVTCEDGTADEPVDLIIVCGVVHRALRCRVGIGRVCDHDVLVVMLVARHAGERPLARPTQLKLRALWNGGQGIHAHTRSRQGVLCEHRVSGRILFPATLIPR